MAIFVLTRFVLATYSNVFIIRYFFVSFVIHFENSDNMYIMRKQNFRKCVKCFTYIEHMAYKLPIALRSDDIIIEATYIILLGCHTLFQCIVRDVPILPE